MSDQTIYCGTYQRMEDGEILTGPLVRYEALRDCEERYKELSRTRQSDFKRHHALEEAYRERISALISGFGPLTEEELNACEVTVCDGRNQRDHLWRKDVDGIFAKRIAELERK